MDDQAPIKFSGSDHFLSNFANFPIRLRDKTWPTTEHYFQAQKFPRSEIEDLIRQAATPNEAKALGSKNVTKRSNWPEIKEQIMYEALLAKFTQHKELKQKLLDTGERELIENTGDLYWGNNEQLTGLNRLGILLMEVRVFIKRLGEDEVHQIRVFEESDPSTRHTFITSAASVSAKRQKTKNRRNVWKDGAGVSLFEIDNDGSGQVHLVGDSIHVPMAALPTKAKFVAKQYQFSKRFEADSDEFSEESYDDEDGNETPKTNYSQGKVQMVDFLSPATQWKPSRTPKACVDDVFEKLEILTALPEGDEQRNFVLTQCQELRKEITHYIQSAETDETVTELLIGQLDALNTALGSNHS